MVRWVAACAALVAVGCFEDRYQCTTDAQCDLGEAGRCEADGFCTAFDRSCETERRYAAHSGEREGTCLDDRVTLANPCASGQPPARPDGCAADVCAALPTCCETGWSDACVQQAQLACDLRCDTRIAVTATRNARTELWDLVWNGTAWTATERTDRVTLLAWLAPPPGGLEPRLAGFSPEGPLLVDDRPFDVPGGRTYQSITSVALDRDGRDKIVLGFQAATQEVQVLDLDTRTSREIVTGVATGLVWGDSDRDAFPDGAAGQGTRYSLLDNLDGADHVRTLSTATSNVNNGTTEGSPPLRELEWLDLDGDRNLDFVVFGSQIRAHIAADRLKDTPQVVIDCDPPRTGCPVAEAPISSYAGTAVPSLGAPALLAAAFPARHVYRLTLAGTPPVLAVALVADECPTCLPIVAATARDLDGDHQLDFIGLDANLRIYTALTTDGFTIKEQPIAARPTLFITVGLSVSGAPIP